MNEKKEAQILRHYRITKQTNCYVSWNGRRHRYSNDAEREASLMAATTRNDPIDFAMFPAMFDEQYRAVIGRGIYQTLVPDSSFNMSIIMEHFEDIANRLYESKRPENISPISGDLLSTGETSVGEIQ